MQFCIRGCLIEKCCQLNVSAELAFWGYNQPPLCKGRGTACGGGFVRRQLQLRKYLDRN